MASAEKTPETGDTTKAPEKAAEKTPETGAKTHIRFVGSADDTEGSTCVVFGKSFTRGKWVPLTNLDGSNAEKKALEPGQLDKLIGNPAFKVGDGNDKSLPGVKGEAQNSEEA